MSATAGKARALIIHEKGKQRFGLAFADNSKKACANALRVMAGEAAVPELDGIPDAPMYDQRTTQAFFLMRTIEALSGRSSSP